MGGESPQKRRLSAAQANVKKPVPEKRGSLPNLLPPLSKRRHDMATKVLPDEPKAAAAPITLPDVATPASAPKGDTLKLPDAPAKATKPAPSASSIKRYKSVLQVSRSKKSGDITLESQRTIDTVLKYQMGQCELRKLKEVFNYIDVDRTGQISFEEFFEFIDENRNPYSESLFRLIGEMTSAMCVAGTDTMFVDTDGSGTNHTPTPLLVSYMCMIASLRILSEFAKLANMVNDGKPLFTGNFNRALKEFDKKNEGVIDFTGFDLLNRRYPMILFPCFRLQDRIQKATLGEAHWLRIHQRYYDMLKDDLFRKKHGGAAPPVSTSTKIKLIFGVGTFEVYQPV
ncbi:hypothetical protein AaE_004449 [Aphanomyces astaci]|uniref:EF-hand domain-containing protein n=1 Tax=Aphanomyces astaci TaxID=112090 RepID=A0A6A5ANE5_APHAT|nr:hypothetical protein AaE_004449 [Aphanomyces astaci]